MLPRNLEETGPRVGVARRWGKGGAFFSTSCQAVSECRELLFETCFPSSWYPLKNLERSSKPSHLNNFRPPYPAPSSSLDELNGSFGREDNTLPSATTILLCKATWKEGRFLFSSFKSELIAVLSWGLQTVESYLYHSSQDTQPEKSFFNYQNFQNFICYRKFSLMCQEMII